MKRLFFLLFLLLACSCRSGVPYVVNYLGVATNLTVYSQSDLLTPLTVIGTNGVSIKDQNGNARILLVGNGKIIVKDIAGNIVAVVNGDGVYYGDGSGLTNISEVWTNDNSVIHPVVNSLISVDVVTPGAPKFKASASGDTVQILGEEIFGQVGSGTGVGNGFDIQWYNNDPGASPVFFTMTANDETVPAYGNVFRVDPWGQAVSQPASPLFFSTSYSNIVSAADALVEFDNGHTNIVTISGGGVITNNGVVDTSGSVGSVVAYGAGGRLVSTNISTLVSNVTLSTINATTINVKGNAQVNFLVVTNGIFMGTNLWSGASNVVDVSIGGQAYQTVTPVQFNGYINSSNSLSAQTQLSIYNNASTNVTITYGQGVTDRDFNSQVTLTNGNKGIWWIQVDPSLKKGTNIVFNQF